MAYLYTGMEYNGSWYVKQIDMDVKYEMGRCMERVNDEEVRYKQKKNKEVAVLTSGWHTERQISMP